MPEPSVLIVHNRYQQAGGEDEVVAAELALLQRHGHAARVYERHNDEIGARGGPSLAVRTLWNQRTYRDVRQALAEHRADVLHAHTTFPLVSPAAYYAARRGGAAVEQTVHNFRLVCPNALLFRDGAPCQDCVGRAVAWPGVRHACYRGHRPATAVTAVMVAAHRAVGTWRRAVHMYIALSAFARARLIAGGLPEDRIVVKANFLADDPGSGAHQGGYALFVGRLSAEKGLSTLVEACARTPGRLPLKIVGSGPLASLAERPVDGVEWLGRRSKADVLALMRDAAVLVLPSTCYENCPMTLLEAFATGLPVIASGHGALAEFVRHDVTGRHVRPGDAADLGEALRWAAAHRERLRDMGAEARREFADRYTARQNYARLLAVYAEARARLAADQRTNVPATSCP